MWERYIHFGGNFQDILFIRYRFEKNCRLCCLNGWAIKNDTLHISSISRSIFITQASAFSQKMRLSILYKTVGKETLAMNIWEIISGRHDHAPKSTTFKPLFSVFTILRRPLTRCKKNWIRHFVAYEKRYQLRTYGQYVWTKPFLYFT